MTGHTLGHAQAQTPHRHRHRAGTNTTQTQVQTQEQIPHKCRHRYHTGIDTGRNSTQGQAQILCSHRHKHHTGTDTTQAQTLMAREKAEFCLRDWSCSVLQTLNLRAVRSITVGAVVLSVQGSVCDGHNVISITAGGVVVSALD